MEVHLTLDGLVPDGLVGVVGYFWPQVMSWAREHILPWIERNIPDLANSVRLAFQDLDKVADDLLRAVRVAWRRLRTVLVSQTAQFIGATSDTWVIRFMACLRAPWHGEYVVYVAGEQELDWVGQPEEIRAAAIANGLNGTWIDIVRARDRLLAGAA